MSDQSSTPSVIFKDVPEFPGYRVGSDGSVWSCRPRTGKGAYPAPWRRMKPGVPGEWGHRQIVLRQSGKSVPRWIHRLMLEVFVGPCPPGMECRHLDGDAGNNVLSNLVWGTPRQNQIDQVEHGTSNRGERHGNAKLTMGKVLEIRRLRAEGLTHKQIGAIVGVGGSCVGGVLRGESWGWTQ